MNVFVDLVAAGAPARLAGLAGFLWAHKSGQYDDLDGALPCILPSGWVAGKQQVRQNDG